MKAPLSKKIKNIINKKEYSFELMRSVIDGQRGGRNVLTVENKTYEVKKISASNFMP